MASVQLIVRYNGMYMYLLIARMSGLLSPGLTTECWYTRSTQGAMWHHELRLRVRVELLLIS